MTAYQWTRDELIHHEAHDVMPHGARPEDCRLCNALAPTQRVGFHCGAAYRPLWVERLEAKLAEVKS